MLVTTSGCSIFFILWLYLPPVVLVNRYTYLKFKEKTLHGRYVVNEQIIRFLEDLNIGTQVETVGYSVEKRPIKSIEIGSGVHKVLMWSQMHGNESTTTKAVVDLLKFLVSNDSLAKKLLGKCTLKIIPILNPDGAEAYTRANANAIDLNRDAQERSQPESKVLRKVYEEFRPHFCFNLHDQRTIFNVGDSSKPATVSFLAPSHDKERSISKSREISMKLIVAINSELQKVIQGQVGRYDDGFNENCIGDTFQMLKTPTILFEAGHFPHDYERERTREYIFNALLQALHCIAENKIASYSRNDYFEIPENNKLFFDVIVKNVEKINPSNTGDIGILYLEKLSDGKVVFEAKIEKAGSLKDYFGHRTFDCAHEDEVIALKKQNFWDLLKP